MAGNAKRGIAPPVDTTMGGSAVAPHRQRILEAALTLLTAGGRDAVTTRAVAEAAGVQPPVLYRLFQDKRGLLDAVTEYGFALYLTEKRPLEPTEDPVQFLREGWARHIHFGLSHPELYLLMYADPRPDDHGRSAAHRHPGLNAHMETIAAAGRLRLAISVAADLFHGAACGVVLTLLATPEKERDMTLSRVACEAALASILTDHAISGDPSAAAAANLLRVQLQRADAKTMPALGRFSAAEAALMLEWLARLTDTL